MFVLTFEVFLQLSIVEQSFDHIFNQVSDQNAMHRSTATEKYSVRIYWVNEIIEKKTI